MKEDYTVYLRHILDAIERIEHHRNMSFEEFLVDVDVQDATIRRLQIIGDATKKLSISIRKKQKHIPWQRIAGMRDVLVHDYATVSLELVWNVIREDIPSLKIAVEDLLRQ